MTLVVGASGATGSLLVEQLLNDGEKVKVIVRSYNSLPESIKKHENIVVIEGTILEFDESVIAEIVKGCDAIASCLGHNMTFKGIFCPPRKLVTQSIMNLSHAIKINKPQNKVKLVLMNSSGNSNRDLNEKVSLGQKFLISLIRYLVPPHFDNEKASDLLRMQIGQSDASIEWVAVRPDGLINEDEVTAYEAYASPIRSAIFDAGSISRINVAHFMKTLITDQSLWNEWKGQMPVIYSKA